MVTKLGILAMNGMLLSGTGNDTDVGALHADTETAGHMLSGLMPMVNTALGIMVWVVVVGIILYTTFELLYINFPIMRNAVSGESGEKKGKGLDKIVSGDARRAVEISDRGEGNPLVHYLKTRVLVYIILGAMIVILVGGQAVKLITLGQNAASGVTNQIQSIEGDGSKAQEQMNNMLVLPGNSTEQK